MSELASIRVTIYGRVQGVFFRAFTSRKANELGITGYVRNLPGGEAVEVQAEGDKERLAQLISYLKVGPPSARVDQIIDIWSEYTGNYSGFSVK